MDSVDDDRLRPECIASTGSFFCKTVGQCNIQAEENEISHGSVDHNESNCFQSAEWSADGTTIVTYNEDCKYRSFVISPEILDKATQLSPYSTTSSPTKCLASAIYPHHNISDPSTTLLLTSPINLPIRLINTLDLNHTHATYKWINPLREEYLTPHSLLFTQSGTRFIAGGIERLAVFDLHRTGDPPISEIQTRKSKKVRKYGERDIGLARIIASLATSPYDGLLAAGTTQRQIGLWANEGSGEFISSFSVEDGSEPDTKGNGIVHMKWSPCGRYLFAAERQSDALLVYDIRATGRRLGWLKGRKAMTTQKLGFDVAAAANGGGGLVIWAGGVDGIVRTWRDVTSKEGAIEPDGAFRASNDAVSAALFQPGGGLLATISGQRRDPQDLLDLSDVDDSDEDEENESSSTLRGDGLDNVMKLWSF